MYGQDNTNSTKFDTTNQMSRQYGKVYHNEPVSSAVHQSATVNK